MFVTEEELAIKITEVDGVKINDVDFTETREDEVLEQFAADAAGAYQQHTRLRRSEKH